MTRTTRLGIILVAMFLIGTHEEKLETSIILYKSLTLFDASLNLALCKEKIKILQHHKLKFYYAYYTLGWMISFTLTPRKF